MLRRTENPFNYILAYKFSQGHIELLFSIIRGRNGFNNNANVHQFKASSRAILLRVSLIGCKQGNCLTFEEEPQNSLFTLKWSKRRTPLIIPEEEQTTDEFSDAPDFITEQNCTPYKEAIIGYIGGYIVKAMVKDISCEVCAEEALLYKKDQMTTALPASFESLIFIKDRGGLITSSADVCKVLTVTEKLFRYFISGVNPNEHKISSSKQIFNKLRLKILSQ